MIYSFFDDAGDKKICIKDNLYKYIVKVRRNSIGNKVFFRSRKNINILYEYEIYDIDGKKSLLNLVSSQKNVVESNKYLHLAWCKIDAKNIEKILPSLCEIGVSKISFIDCDRSQKNFKIDFKRLDRVVEASMQQSGRTSYLDFDIYSSIKDFIKEFPDTVIMDLCDKYTNNEEDTTTVLIGPEGGFSLEEKYFFDKEKIFRFKTSSVLRSETAIFAVASKILL